MRYGFVYLEPISRMIFITLQRKGIRKDKPRKEKNNSDKCSRRRAKFNRKRGRRGKNKMMISKTKGPFPSPS